MFIRKIFCFFISALAGIMGIFAQIPNSAQGSMYNNPWVQNVEEKFSNLNSQGIRLAAYNYGPDVSQPAIPDAHCRYRDCVLHNAGFVGFNCCSFIPVGGLSNHFQGIARLPEYLGLGNYVLVTGGNNHTDTDIEFGPAGHLFVICLASQSGSGPFEYGQSRADRIINVLNLTEDAPGYTHPGGIQTCGKYLVVPMEGTGINGKIIFYAMGTQNNMLKLAKLPVEIPVETQSCGAAALTRLTDGHYLVAHWSVSTLFLYYSTRTDLEHEQLFIKIATITSADIIPSISWEYFQPGQTPQNINLVNDENGTLYVLTNDNTGQYTPVIKGTDFAALFKLDIPENINPDDPTGGCRLIYLSNRAFVCNRDADFKAAAGFYIPNQKNIALYASYHWLKGWNLLCHNFKNSYISIMQFI
ncbi:MAG: hypothetical protein WC365_06975 [Candidatus Babeliales bacterium]|jgi:hypothetical protein